MKFFMILRVSFMYKTLLQYIYEAVKCFQAFFCAFVYAGVFEYLAEDFTDFLLKDMFDVILIYIGIGRKEFVYPVRVFLDLFVAADVFALKNVFFQEFHLAFQTGRKNSKSHYLDQTDVLFLDVVQFCVRMVNAKRMLLSGNVVPESQIQLV